MASSNLAWVVVASCVAACGGGNVKLDAPSAPDAVDDTPSDATRADAPPSGRATSDQPDDSDLPQVHVIYALASDGADRAFDINGDIARSVGLWNTWLGDQFEGRRLRLDTAGGNLDVTFARLDRSEAQLAAAGLYLRDELEAALGRAGRLVPHKLYAVFYDGPTTVACGGGAYPPTLVGQVGALYLRGQVGDAPACDSNGLGQAASPQYLEFAMLHELMHNLGLVATCAPNHTLSGHTSDSPNDLMYAGNQPWTPSALDVGGDDYAGSAPGTCLRLDDSAFLDPSPPSPQLPPGWS